MIKKIFLSIILFCLLDCQNKQKVVTKDKVENKDNNTVSAKDGGEGFEDIAESLGYKTNIGKDYSNPKASKGGSLTVSFNDYPSVFRPYGPNSIGILISSVVNPIYKDTLIKYNMQTGKFERDIIDFWKFSADKKTAWFRINPKVRFSDGEPLTVDDIIATQKLVLDDNLSDPINKKSLEVYKIEKISSYIMKVSVSSNLWKVWTKFKMYIHPKKYLEKIDPKTYSEKYTKDVMPGLGPYLLDKEKTKEGSLISLKKNKDWWGYVYPENKNTFNFDTVNYKIVREDKLEKEYFKRGELDLFQPFTSAWYSDLLKQGSNFDPIKRNLIVKKVFFNGNPKSFLGLNFNLTKAPFDNLNVRKALSYAFNKDIIIDKIYHGDLIKYFTLYPLSKWGSKNIPSYEFDLTKAGEILDEAGYNIKDDDGIRKDKDGNRLEFSMPYYSELNNDRIHVQLQQDYLKIGVKLNLEALDYPNFIKRIYDKDYTMAYTYLGGSDFPEPETMFLSKLANIKGTKNIWGFKNDEVDDLIKKYQVEQDESKRYDYIHKIDEIVNENFIIAHAFTAPYAWRFLYWNKFGKALPYNSVSGLWFLDMIQYWYVDPEKEKMLEKAKEDKSVNLDEDGNIIFDPLNLKPADFTVEKY